jgi:hypothetical protein
MHSAFIRFRRAALSAFGILQNCLRSGAKVMFDMYIILICSGGSGLWHEAGKILQYASSQHVKAKQANGNLTTYKYCHLHS